MNTILLYSACHIIMRTFEICIFCVFLALVFRSKPSEAELLNEDDVLMKNISELHFQLFSSIQKKTKMIKTAVFETQCSGTGCTFNGCESSGSETCDGQMFTKLNKIQLSINDIWKRKPEVIVCKDGWKRYNGHCYHFFSKKMNWFQAQVFCRNQNTTLVQINDANEHNWLTKNFPIVAYWIDFTDIGTEGKWVTLSTGKSEYTRWQSGQPDNYRGNQNCAYNMKGSWDDHSCKSTYQVLCEASGTL
ncbi:C-type lectin domain family 10 member A-like [Crassostrea angulata]|uniref:C-type lectin domain family 10 member A-like n=1 Tax=Magallana angulata TaxID=2784310 RepID=UPI0022B1BC44|nr:C-type lectin domain family 10 member A-like [Crassostrea angulata]